MIRDERIRETKNRIASRAFGIWYYLLLVNLFYRQFYLRQAPKEYWDIALIFFAGTLYVSIAGFAKGAVYESSLARYWKWTVPTILVTILVLNFFQGRLNTIEDFLVTLISALIGVAFIGLVFYFLYRRWEKKIGLED
jgi:VanZ family protein